MQSKQIAENFEYPNKIKVSGLPFMLQGWNTTFYKTDQQINGKPVYKLNSYRLYYILPIIGVEIFFDSNCWQFRRICDNHSLYECGQLFGEWPTSTNAFCIAPVY